VPFNNWGRACTPSRSWSLSGARKNIGGRNFRRRHIPLFPFLTTSVSFLLLEVLLDDKRLFLRWRSICEAAPLAPKFVGPWLCDVIGGKVDRCVLACSWWG